MSNTIVYAEEWAIKLQERLAEPTKWKSCCKVVYTNLKTLNNPYLTEAAVQTNTRGAAYTPQDITMTNETIAIDTSKILAQVIDQADLAQTTFVDQMVLADKQGVLLNEAIESAWLGDHGNMTNFGDTGGGVLGLSATQITVTANNIDDIIRGVKREFRKASGQTDFNREGGFIVWRPADLELLEAFMQANGFQSADKSLDGNGALDAPGEQGIYYMGLWHYSSNLLAANHVIAGVKNKYHLGIVKDTYGQVKVNQDPYAPSGTGQMSGISVVSRVDFKGKVWHNVAPLLFDVNVA